MKDDNNLDGIKEFYIIYQFWRGKWQQPQYKNISQEEYLKKFQHCYDNMSYSSKLYIRQFYSDLPKDFKQDDNILMAAL